jgi:hypothetical protein
VITIDAPLRGLSPNFLADPNGEPFVQSLHVEPQEENDDDNEATRTPSSRQSNTPRGKWIDTLIHHVVPGGLDGRLHKLWKLFGNEAVGIMVSLTELLLLFVSIFLTHIESEREWPGKRYDTELTYWLVFFVANYCLRFSAEACTWGLAIAYQKYRRIGATPLSLEWQPGRLLDFYVISGIEIVVGIITILVVGAAPSEDSNLLAVIMTASFLLLLVGLLNLAWTCKYEEDLTNDGAALVRSVAVTRIVALTWEIWSAVLDITYIAAVSSRNGRSGCVGFLLLLELARIAWEVYAEVRNANLHYICGKVLIPITCLDIFEFLNSERAEALKSNAKVDGFIAVTSTNSTSQKIVDEIRNLIPVLNTTGPLVGGEWFSLLGGHARDARFTVKLAIMAVTDSEAVMEQDGFLYIMTSPRGPGLQSGLVISKDGSAQFSDTIARNEDKCSRWQGVRIVG